jgi:hypothetical protein
MNAEDQQNCHEWRSMISYLLSRKAYIGKHLIPDSNDPDYHQLISHKYNDGNVAREVNSPKVDILHHFQTGCTK